MLLNFQGLISYVPSGIRQLSCKIQNKHIYIYIYIYEQVYTYILIDELYNGMPAYQKLKMHGSGHLYSQINSGLPVK